MTTPRTVPEIVIFGLASLLPAYGIRFAIGPLPSTALELALLISMVALARAVPLRRALPEAIRARRLLAAGSFFILMGTAVGIVVAPDTRAALGVARAYFWEPIALAWILIAARPDPARAFAALRTGFMVSAAAVIGFAFIQFFFPSLIPAPWDTERRVTSLFAFPNATALFLAPVLPILVTARISAALAPLGAAAIILARSAGGAIAAAASFAFLGLTHRRLRFLAVIVIASTLLTITLHPALGELRDELLLRDWSGRVHLIGWRESLDMLGNHPIWGAGLSGYPTAVAPYHTAQGVEIFQYPHNLLLAIWSELGLVGIAGAALVAAWFLRRRRHPAITAAFIAILVHGVVDVPYFKNDLSVMCWILIALVAIMETPGYARRD